MQQPWTRPTDWEYFLVLFYLCFYLTNYRQAVQAWFRLEVHGALAIANALVRSRSKEDEVGPGPILVFR